MSEVREFAVDTPRGCSELSTRVHIRGGTWLRSNAPFQGPKRRAAHAPARGSARRRRPGRGPPGPSRPLAARGRGGGGVLSVSPAPGAWCRSCTTAPGSSLHALPRRRGLRRPSTRRGPRSAVRRRPTRTAHAETHAARHTHGPHTRGGVGPTRRNGPGRGAGATVPWGPAPGASAPGRRGAGAAAPPTPAAARGAAALFRVRSR